MFKSRKLSLSLLTLSVSSALLLTACGGDSGGSSGGNPPAAATLTGRVVDGPIANATVTFTDEATACKNKTATTDENGVFTFPQGCTASALKVTGGQDTTTGLPFTATLQAPKISLTDTQGIDVVVTPITTLVATVGTDKAAAIATALGLPGTNLLTADPLNSAALLAKTTAIQQLNEQISTAVTTLNTDGSLTSTIAQKAITAALISQLTSSTTTVDLGNTNTINAIIQATVKDADVKAKLPALQNNIDNVATNLAALTSASIAANVKTVETTLAALPATQISSAAALKTAAQEKILTEKNDSTTVNLIQALSQVLATDRTAIESALKDIAEAATTGGAATDKLTGAIAVIKDKTGIVVPTETITEANKFTNYLLLNGLGLQGTSYTLDQLAASLITPIKVSSLNNLLVPLVASDSYKSSNQAVAAALKVETATKALLISANQLNLTYTNGTLTAATLPKGSTVGITSTTSELNTNLTLGTDIDVLSNGQIALNSTTLGKISASLVSSLNKFNSEKGTATVTAVVAPSEGQIIAATSKSFATKYTVSVLSKSITGYGTSAKVTVE
jgi:hypothetical protein